MVRNKYSGLSEAEIREKEKEMRAATRREIKAMRAVVTLSRSQMIFAYSEAIEAHGLLDIAACSPGQLYQMIADSLARKSLSEIDGTAGTAAINAHKATVAAAKASRTAAARAAAKAKRAAKLAKPEVKAEVKGYIEPVELIRPTATQDYPFYHIVINSEEVLTDTYYATQLMKYNIQKDSSKRYFGVVKKEQLPEIRTIVNQVGTLEIGAGAESIKG